MRSLRCLSQEYSYDKMYDFLFTVNEQQTLYNQKWHFFVSYLAYREYASYREYQRESAIPGVTPLKPSDAIKIRIKCPELQLWLEGCEAGSKPV